MLLYHPTYSGLFEFGKIFCAPGARGFFGEGYPFHRYWKKFGMTWRGTSLAGKTWTLSSRSGNMPLEADGLTPREYFPRCIVVRPESGHVLNAVGLSNFGTEFLLRHPRLYRIDKPFCLSFMSVSATKEERLADLREYVELMRSRFPRFQAMAALQINFACPNAGLHLEELRDEVCEVLEIAAALQVPLIPNFNPLVPVDILVSASRHPACSALWIANTIPWGTPGIPWRRIFWSTTSPLLKRGFAQQGGLSGPKCLPFTIRKVREAREAGITLPIVAGNGIQKVRDVKKLKDAGASAIAIGCVGVVRPWRMRKIIQTANEIF